MSVGLRRCFVADLPWHGPAWRGESETETSERRVVLVRASESACVAACARPFVAFLLAWWMGLGLGLGPWPMMGYGCCLLQTAGCFPVAVMARGQWRESKKRQRFPL